MKKIAFKIFFTALFPTIMVGLAAGFMIIYLTAGSGKSSLFAYEQTMRRDFDTTAKWQTENVKSLIYAVYQKYENGEISFIEAKKTSAELVRKIKYGNDGYFWIDSIDGTNIVSSVRELEGKNRYEMKDSDGKFIIKEFIKVAQNGGGFVDYRFPKISGQNPLPKRSYLLLFEPFGWVIGTGNYTDDIDNAVNEMKSEQDRMLLKMIIGIILLLSAASIFVLIQGRKISKPVVNLTKKAKLISEGDLNINIDKESNDEIGVLGNSLRIMIEKLSNIIDQINYEAERTVLASKEFISASKKISDGANILASTSEEVASSIEEMTASIYQNSMNSQETQKLSFNVLSGIKSSSKSVKRNAKALETIINEISVIKEIAAQTNILALNATVEAASAGQFGKSFAVIAKEIKILSDQSADAAKRIDKLSVESIMIADESVLKLKNLLPEMETVINLVKNINSAGEEQKSGASQINNEVMRLNRLSQENASISEETEANSNELSEQAMHLLDVISFFNKNKGIE